MGNTASLPSDLSQVQPVKYQIAIDFGTSHSGFSMPLPELSDALTSGTSISDIGDVQRLNLTRCVKYKSSWPGSTASYPKTRTALLYHNSGRIIAWGNEACTRYLEMCSADQANHIFIDKFKLLLDTTNKIPNTGMERLKARFNKTPVDVISDYLREMAGTIREFIEEPNPNEKWNPNHTRWCLTVPAMWSDVAKLKMRDAMFKAGLIQTLNSDRLEFCSEPMAGLIHETITVDSMSTIHKDDPVLIVDLGGGTVDLTVMRMCDNGFQELVEGSGATCGSTLLDTAFIAMFKEAIGAGAYQRIISNKPQHESTIRSSWEFCKLAFTGTEPNFRTKIQVPAPLERARVREDLDPVPGTGGAYFDEGDFYITYETMELLYAPIVDNVHELVRRMIRECKEAGVDLRHIYCVGGFSQSRYLINMLRRRLMEQYAKKVIVSPNGSSAVVLGAIVFALRPNLLLHQIARVTYGTTVRTTYSESRFGPRAAVRARLENDEDGEWIRGVFSVIIRRRDKLVPGTVVATKVYWPSSSSQQKVVIDILVSTDCPKFADEGGCRQIGSIDVAVTPCQSSSKRDSVKVTVTMQPSGLLFSAINQRTQAYTQCHINLYE
ncbi:hypothetical protein AMAG_13163 [Allomyces macrogynus ATCC 38327]|uniref:Hsp70-like protein n=1 Tax=Allomyces macrogynus (strain ATCC 38327) TaxID=578462 RepID=A0A0L0SZT1_ALLM3|nr:hypothetical protein AMAG_13163 [Allomyces macrogynus ATCC 38327]|eukprot:KNE67986.1 hypothetical protein AMAG_13163 [Allomyces macrogynus ATCC 38327]